MLRAMLTEDFGEYERIAERLEQTNSVEGNNLLVAGAFYEAVNRRFGNGYTIPAIIQFVAHERTRFDDAENDIDPSVAERLTLAMLGNGSAEGMDERAKAQAELALLMGLVVDQNLDDGGLDEFLLAAQKVAKAALRL